MNHQELFEKSKQFVPGGVHSPVRSFKGLHTTPKFIQRAEGAYLFDEEGKDYIDFCMSFGPMILGHRNQKVENAVKEALTRGWSFGACEKYSLELAEFIISNIPFLEQIRFVNSGTEAVMTAIRLAKGHTQKNKIVKFNGCYHGHVDSMLIKAGSGLAGTSSASSRGVSPQTSEETLICELGSLDKLEEVLMSHKGQVAAVFIEPLPANNGLIPQAKEYLQGLRSLCDQYEALLVFDEVISGFRVEFGGMATYFGVTPDIVTYGKIIGGGFPVGAVASTKEIMQNLAPLGEVYQAGTLSANPVAMVAGLENLKQLTPEFYSTLKKQTNTFIQVFKEWLNSHDYDDYQIIHFESLFWPMPKQEQINNVQEIPSNLNERFYSLFETLLSKGIYLSPNAYEIGFMSIAHNEEVLKDFKKRLWN